MVRIVAFALAVAGLTSLLYTGCSRPAAPTAPTPSALEPAGQVRSTDGTPADTEDKAVAFIEKLGGKVTRDEKAPGKPVLEVVLDGTELTDAGLKALAPLTNLTKLILKQANPSACLLDFPVQPAGNTVSGRCRSRPV